MEAWRAGQAGGCRRAGSCPRAGCLALSWHRRRSCLSQRGLSLLPDSGLVSYSPPHHLPMPTPTRARGSDLPMPSGRQAAASLSFLISNARTEIEILMVQSLHRLSQAGPARGNQPRPLQSGRPTHPENRHAMLQRRTRPGIES